MKLSIRRFAAMTVVLAAALPVADSLRTAAAPLADAAAHVYAIRGAKVYTLAGPPVENGRS